MSKQQTPLQKAIARLTEVRDKAENIDKERANAYHWTIDYLKSLLDEEKAFAASAFTAGDHFFVDFYKQYEDE